MSDVRDELKGQNLSFTEIAKLVGERWKVLAPEDKEAYEFKASVAKDKYNSEFEEYKKTEKYQEYMRYLAEFRSKTNKENKTEQTTGGSPSGILQCSELSGQLMWVVKINPM